MISEATLQAVTLGGDLVALGGIVGSLYYLRRSREALREASDILRAAIERDGTPPRV